MKKKEIQIPFATERKWYCCRHCGQKLLIYDDMAKCRGVYVKCKSCGREVEVKI